MSRDVDEPVAEDDDGLPPEDDPSWAEGTQDTLRFLHGVRRAHRRGRLRSHAYTGYVTTLILGIYVVPPVLQAARTTHRQTSTGAPAATVCAVAATVLVVLVALVRDGLWRGPILLDPASAAWLLPLPVDRAALLRPRLQRAAVTAGLAGAVVGGLGGVLLRLADGGFAEGSAVLPAAGGVVGGAVVMVFGVGVGALVETAGPGVRTRWRRAGAVLWVLPAIPAALALGASHLVRTGATIVLWSGPWGWALQPLAATARPGVPGIFWPVALVAAAGAAGLVLRRASRRVTAVTNQVLRARAATVSAVTQSLGTLQPRRARLLVEAAQGRSPRTRRRLPIPRSPLLLIAWRDATAVLRSPSRLVWGLIWCAVAAPLAADSGGRTGLPRFGLALAALLAGYLAVSQLAEGARLDADDPRVILDLPLDPQRLVLGHLITPVGTLLPVLALSVPVLMAVGPSGGRPVAVLTVLAGGLPALGGAALVSAFRGDIPLGILAGGSAAASPMGNPGPLLVVLWYVRGPLVASALLIPAALGRASLTGSLLAAVVMIGWAVLRFRRVLR